MQIGKGKNPIGKVRYISQKYSNNGKKGRTEEWQQHNKQKQNKTEVTNQKQTIK